jgi:hypothetical protein
MEGKEKIRREWIREGSVYGHGPKGRKKGKEERGTGRKPKPKGDLDFHPSFLRAMTMAMRGKMH